MFGRGGGKHAEKGTEADKALAKEWHTAALEASRLHKAAKAAAEALPATEGNMLAKAQASSLATRLSKLRKACDTMDIGAIKSTLAKV